MDLVDTAFDPPAATTVDDVVVDFIDLQYQQTVMTAAGDLAAQHLKSFYPGDPLAIPPIPPGSNAGRAFVLIVEGTILANEFATMAYDRTVGDEIPVGEAVANLAASADCLAVIALGQCAAFGNWPAARNQKASGTDYARTQGLPVTSFLATRGISKTVVNLSGCPPQPEVFLLTVADFLTGSLTFINDGTNRPSPYYDHTLHWANGYAVDDPAFQGCPRFYDYKGWDPVTGQDRPPKFATKRGDDGCLIMIGCKGPSTKTPCTVYQYLGKRSFCTKSSTPCQGCHEKGYPDKFSPYLEY
jgi:hydrogenase small subunit